MGHTFSHILLHVIVSTKGRQPYLGPDQRPGLLAYLAGIAHNEGVLVLEAAAVEDHVHLLLAVRPTHAAADAVRVLKANSSGWVHQNWPDLRDFAWQSGFGVFSVSASAADAVTAYVAKQEAHHRRVSFAEELRLFLQKHGVDYDPDHYLD